MPDCGTTNSNWAALEHALRTQCIASERITDENWYGELYSAILELRRRFMMDRIPVSGLAIKPYVQNVFFKPQHNYSIGSQTAEISAFGVRLIVREDHKKHFFLGNRIAYMFDQEDKIFGEVICENSV